MTSPCNTFDPLGDDGMDGDDYTGCTVCGSDTSCDDYYGDEDDDPDYRDEYEDQD